MVEHFKLGASDRTLGYGLPLRDRKDGAVIRDRLVKLGVYRESGHEHFSGCLVIPIFDEAKNVQGLYGRKIGQQLKPDIARHLYLPGPHKGVWNVQALQASREIILCEALIDALSFWCAGYRNVTAAYGVHGVTPDHFEAFKRYGTERILVAFDRDDAGEKAAAELAPRLAEAGIDVSRILFPKGMDANEYAKRVTPAEESLGVAIRAAQFVAKGRRAAVPVSEAPPLAAPPEPPPAAEGALRALGEEVEYQAGDRQYRVRGLSKNLSYDTMRLSVRVARGDKLHVDTFDLLSARQRATYTKQAALEIAVREEIVKRDLGHLLLELEALQERRIREATEPKQKAIPLSEAEKAEALELLRDPRLLDRIVLDFEKIGLVGEETNKITAYLAATSRMLEEPLAILVQSNSAAGKSTLMDAVLSMMPEEAIERYSALTGQSLFYLSDSSLKHKILAVAEAEGALRAGYALKLLQSEGRISIATTTKDPETGDMKTKRHEVEGPVSVMLTTTAAVVDEELQNRALVLTVSEDREQTRAIHERQRRAQTLEGMLRRQDREKVLRLHKNVQRLLKPILVVNPHADKLTFLDAKLRTRRDHQKYLTLIRVVALLRQFQKPTRQVEHGGRVIPYIEASKEDIAVANHLAAEVLGRSLDDLAPQTRRLLLLLEAFVLERCRVLGIERGDYRFSRRDVREHTRWGDTQLRIHLERLVDLELLLVHHGGRGQSFVYELAYDGQGKDGQPFLIGLLDPARLSPEYDSKFAGGNGDLAGPARGLRGPFAAASRGAGNGLQAVSGAAKGENP